MNTTPDRPARAPRPVRGPVVRPRRGVMSLGTLTLVFVALGCSVLVVKRMTDENPAVNLLGDHGVVAGSDTAPATAPVAQAAIGTANARGLDGKVIPLVPKGRPTIVMLSSRTCGWCKKALKDLGELSAGRPLPNLTLLTLEGAAEGVPMVKAEGITGARLVGPTGSKEQVLLTFRYPGTPTFVSVDRNGRVVRTLPGYPVRPEMERWFAVMVGDAEVP